MDQLQGAVATAEEAVQEHLKMRERQTDRIKKAKSAGLKGQSRTACLLYLYLLRHLGDMQTKHQLALFPLSQSIRTCLRLLLH